MAECWVFTTPVVEEAPFAWNALHERYRMPRAISIKEVQPGQYAAVRYYSYTDEIGAENLPVNPNEQDTDFYPAPSEGLHFFRGGYEWKVDGQVRDDIIASNIGVTEANFVPCAGDGGYGSGGYGGGGFGG